MKYKYVLFDLDGTLTDPKVGITKSVQYALKKFNIYESLENLEKFIGPPLKDSFMEFYSFKEEDATIAIDYYRDYFRVTGIYENKLYEGIVDLLKILKKQNKVLIVATSKPTLFAEKIVKYFDIKEYFDLLIGSNLDGTRSYKSDIIKFILEQLKINSPSDCIMIGDRKYDILGAKENKIDSIAVTYGYGSKAELLEANPTYVIDSIENLRELLVGSYL